MGQVEVLKILKEDKWLRSKDIAKKLKYTRSTITTSLRKLLKEGLILKRNYNKHIFGYEWMLK